VSERYEILGVLGEGGFGVVYEAFDHERGRLIALKTLRGASAQRLVRLKREFRSLVDLDHPNLVTLYELVANEGLLYFTMEHVDGAVPFDEWARRGEAGLRGALPQVVAGLAALHARGLIHRDIKPSNVLVDRGGRVVLVDFGLVHDIDRESTSVAGTPAYMAPEQHSGLPLTSAVDAYGLGVMLFETLAGRRPWVGTYGEVIAQKQAQDAPSLRAACPDAPPDLIVFVDSLLVLDPTRRASLSSLALEGGTPRDDFFVGRVRALSRLRDALSFRGELVEIVGPSGMGKTALMNHFVQELEGTMVLRGRCHPREDVAYKAFDGIMDELSRRMERSPELERVLPRDSAALAALFPVMRGSTSSASSTPAPPTRERGIAACRELFTRLGEHTPVVLAIDDIQWGDADSASLLIALLREPDPPPIFIVTTRRDDEVGALMARFERSCAGGTRIRRSTISLGPLGRQDSERLAAMLMPDTDRAAEVVSESGGHPLFLHELALQRVGASLSELLSRRVRELPQGARRALTILSLAGYPFPRGALEALTSPASCDALSASGLARNGPVGVRVYHDRVAEVVLGELDAVSSSDLHRTLADTWIARAGEPDRIALHLVAAGDGRAPSYLLSAARRAESSLGFRHAAKLYGELLGWVEGGATAGLTKGELYEALAAARMSAGQPADAAKAYLAAAGLSEGEAASSLRLFAGAQAAWGGDTDRAWEIFAIDFPELGTRFHQHGLRASGKAALNLATAFVGQRLRPKVTSRGKGRTLDALWTAFGAVSSLDPLQSLLLVSKYRAEAARTTDPLHRFRSESLGLFRSALLNGASGWAERRAHLDAAYVDLADSPDALMTLHCFRSVLDSLGFRPASTIVSGTEGWNHAIEHGLEWSFEAIGTRQLLAHSLDATGDIEARHAFALRVLAEANERNHGYLWQTGTIHLAAVVRIRGDLAESRRLMGRVREGWRAEFRSHSRNWRYADSIGQALAEGDAAGAHRAATTEVKTSPLERVASMPNLSMYDALWEARAAIAYAAKSPRERPALLRKAERVRRAYRKEPSVYCLAVSLGLEAGIMSVLGDTGAALRALRATLRVAEEANCVMLLALVQRELAVVDDDPRLMGMADAFFAASSIDDPVYAARLILPGNFNATASR